MTSRFGAYHRERIGWFFGLSGGQLMVMSAAAMPVFFALRRGAWSEALVQAGVWGVVSVVVLLRVRGRSTIGWVHASLRFAVGRRLGWSAWRSHAADGQTESVDVPDLPGPLQHLTIHAITVSAGGPGMGVVQHHPARVWAVVCRLTHPGIGMADDDTRDRMAAGLTALLDAAARTELISDVLLMVRVGPDDGAERQVWTARHRRPDAPALADQVNQDLQTWATTAAVRTETYLTLVVPEARIARPVRQSGAGLPGRLRVLQGLAEELEPAVRHELGATGVDWLTPDGLAVACRTGYHPADHHGLVTAQAEHETNPAVAAGVPWALAGPAAAVAEPRCYHHDGWRSVSITVGLPDQGAAVGALAPLLAPAVPGEGRSLLVAFPILPEQTADRRTANAEWAADIGDELRRRARVKQRAKSRDETSKARGIDARLARGHALTSPYAVATVTVPADQSEEDAARRLDAAARRAGYPPLRLDLAHDLAFAASSIPLGLTLHRR